MESSKLHSSKTFEFLSADTGSNLEISAVGGIKAGFPSPADDFSDLSIDLNKELVKHPYSTFYARANGNSMKDAGIGDGDLLVIDKSIEPTDGKVAVCYIDGEFTVKRIRLEKDCCWLVAENQAYQPIKITEANDFVIWGIVTHIIKAL